MPKINKHTTTVMLTAWREIRRRGSVCTELPRPDLSDCRLWGDVQKVERKTEQKHSAQSVSTGVNWNIDLYPKI